MKKLPSRLRLLLLYIIFGCIFTLSAEGFQLPPPVKQTPEAVEAYNVCRLFQRLLGENLDFARAYEATFTKSTARRRAIAIADGEFGKKDLAQISDDLLINAYKQRMQIFYLMLILAGSGKGELDSVRLLPPEIEKIAKREAPNEVHEFPDFVSQLERDAVFLRSHLENLIASHPSFAKSVREFKKEIFPLKFAPPRDYKVVPSQGYYSDRMLNKNEKFYEIDGYYVTKEQGKMRIAGIRFFTRLF